MSKSSFKEERALHSNFLSKVQNMKRVPGIFSIQREYATYQIDDSFPYHYHDWYELYHLHYGKGVFRLQNREYPMNDGVWLFAPMGMEHKMNYTSESHERTLIYFTKEYLPLSLFSHLPKLRKPIYITDNSIASSLDSLMNKLQSEFDNPDEFSFELYKSLLYEILVYLMRASSEPPADYAEQDMLTNHVIDYIKTHFDKQIRLEELAEINDISASHLSKKFKLVTGMNFSYYLNSIRIEQSKKLLAESTLSISEISEKCGFNDSNYFSYVFKKSEGISPISFRKAMQSVR